jgi:hypothetical protein
MLRTDGKDDAPATPAPGVTQDPPPPLPDNGAPELATDWVELLLALILFELPDPLIVYNCYRDHIHHRPLRNTKPG